MEKKISKLDQHYIICGSGDTGRHVINEFIKTRNPCVVIEKDENEIKTHIYKSEELLYIIGDASSETVLKEAGIDRAKGLVTTFASDKENLFVVLTARNLNQNLRIVTRCIEEESEHKLKTAGADSIVSANSIGGLRMASAMLRPTVVSFLDVMLRDEDAALRVEEALIQKDSKVDGLTIKEANIPKNIGLIIIAVKDADTGKYVYNPQSGLKLKAGDTIIVLGKPEQIKSLWKYTAA